VRDACEWAPARFWASPPSAPAARHPALAALRGWLCGLRPGVASRISVAYRWSLINPAKGVDRLAKACGEVGNHRFESIGVYNGSHTCMVTGLYPDVALSAASINLRANRLFLGFNVAERRSGFGRSALTVTPA
jgi:hypothetical protein